MSSRNDPRTFLESLTPYRLPSAHSNFAYRVPLGRTWVFLKVYGLKKPRSKYEIRQFLGLMGLRQPVEYRSPKERKSFEEKTLRHWKEAGFIVPDVMDSPFPELSALPYLATTFIEGSTLRELLVSSRLSVEDKKALLSSLFDEIARRHERAFSENDWWLFHIDANTRNIIYTNHDRICHVDFEMGRPWESTTACAAREITKLLITSAEEISPPEREILFQSFQNAYPHQEVLDIIRQSVYSRSFQLIHRWNDTRRKNRNPQAVTLYDILDHLPSRVTSP